LLCASFPVTHVTFIRDKNHREVAFHRRYWLREAEAFMQKIERDQSQEIIPGVALHQRVDPKCANPACPVVFHWLIGGKFFRFADKQCESCDHKTGAAPSGKKNCGGHCVKHFWLCERCSDVFSLTYRKPDGVILKLLRAELQEAETEAAAAIAG
jgi:hypothetical protein